MEIPSEAAIGMVWVVGTGLPRAKYVSPGGPRTGAGGTCKRLLEKSEVSEGFTCLRELRRDNLAIQAVALRPCASG